MSKLYISNLPIIGQPNKNGNIDVVYKDTKDPVKRLRLQYGTIYPIGAKLSTEYEHFNGIEISMEDAKFIGLEINGD